MKEPVTGLPRLLGSVEAAAVCLMMGGPRRFLVRWYARTHQNQVPLRFCAGLPGKDDPFFSKWVVTRDWFSAIITSYTVLQALAGQKKEVE